MVGYFFFSRSGNLCRSLSSRKFRCRDQTKQHMVIKVQIQIVPPVNIPIPTKIPTEMGGAPIPTWDLIGLPWPRPQVAPAPTPSRPQRINRFSTCSAYSPETSSPCHCDRTKNSLDLGETLVHTCQICGNTVDGCEILLQRNPGMMIPL